MGDAGAGHSNGPESQRMELEIRKLDAELALKRVEMTNRLTSYGLRGTLIGAIGGIVMVVALAILGSFAPDCGITGGDIIWIVGLICVTVSLYGAFVFNRSASIVAHIGEQSIQVSTEKTKDRHGGP